MRSLIVVALLLTPSVAAGAQAPGKWPPDSLINTHVIPRGTPVMQVIGTMRDFASHLGVRCTYCHVGEEGEPLPQLDFASDQKRNKLVARQMMRMVQEVNRRLDTIPEPGAPEVNVTCATCHRGVSRPVPLSLLVSETAITAGADSAVRAYRALRERHFGRDAYDFGVLSLNAAALRTARTGRTDEALALLQINQEQFPDAAAVHVTRGNVLLIRGDTAAAAESLREALRRDPRNFDARSRLRDIGREP